MPLTSSLRIDGFLTNLSLLDTNEAFIHDKILPSITVSERKGKIAKYKGDNLRDFNAQRSVLDTDYHVIDHAIDTPVSYEIETHDLAEIITDEQLKLYQKPFDARQDALTVLMEAKNILMERGIATDLANSSLLTNTSTPSTLWDAASSDPLGDMETAAEAIRLKKGRRPNYAVTNSVVISKLKANAQFVDRINGVQKNLTTADVIDIIKNHLGIQDVYVGTSIYESAVEGQTSSRADIWSDDFVLYYKPSAATLRTTTFGFRLLDPKTPQTIKIGRIPTDKGDVVEAQWGYQDKIIDVDAAYLLDQVIT